MFDKDYRPSVTHDQTKPLFREVQQFRQWWIWLIIASSVVPLAILIYGTVKQLVFKQPFGTNQNSDVTLIITTCVAAIPCLGVPLLLLLIKLITEVRPDGLFIRFFPVHLRFKKVDLKEAKAFAAVKYSPIEYGGYGIKGTFGGGRVYNISGNRGLRLDFHNGNHLIIGSQRPDELAQAITSICDLPPETSE